MRSRCFVCIAPGSTLAGGYIEDRIVTATGSYSATATQASSTTKWIMQMIAFKAAASGADTQAPTVPTGVLATVASGTQINLSWTASTDNVGVTGYLVERCQGAGCSSFAQIATPSSNSYNDTGRSPSTSYSYRIRARDAANNLSGYSATVSGTTSADSQAPTVPSGLTATVVSSSQINLSWTASTDNVAVTGYVVERCQGAACTTFAQIATPATTTFNDTGLAAATTYRYRILARDAVPNYSAASSVVNATTQAAADTQAPTTPTALTITAGAGQLSLAWGASTDNVAVTAYLVERCAGAGCSYVQIASVTTTSYIDTNVLPGTNYSYRVRARDAVPNYSGYVTSTVASPAACD